MSETQGPLVVLNFLSDTLGPTYRLIGKKLAQALDCEMKFVEGATLDDLRRDDWHLGFLCGAPYASTQESLSIVATPVLAAPRYAMKPIYYSDIVVASDSSFARVDDLEGSRWCYNGTDSLSGYWAPVEDFARRGWTKETFQSITQSGSHRVSLENILEGRADAAAIDSHLLEVLMQQEERFRSGIKVIASLGPFPIQPLVSPKPEEEVVSFRRALLNAKWGDEPEWIAGGMSGFVHQAPSAYGTLPNPGQVGWD